jgi:hypothetical protein
MGLNVREDTRKGVYVENLIEEGVTGADAAGSILQRGYRNRYICMHTLHTALYMHVIQHCALSLVAFLKLRTQHQFQHAHIL